MRVFYVILILCLFLRSSLVQADTIISVPFKIDAPIALKLADVVSEGTKHGDTLKNVVDNFPSTDAFFRVNEQAYDYIDIWEVNPWTGDVWNIWSCTKRTNPEAQKIQAEIRQRFTPEELNDYDRLSAIEPQC